MKIETRRFEVLGVYILFCLLLLQGCFPNTSSPNVLTPEKIMETLNICENIFNDTFYKHGAEEAFRQVVEFLKANKNVKTLQVIGNHCFYEMIDGTNIVFSIEYETNETNGLGGSSANVQILTNNVFDALLSPPYVFSPSAVAPRTKRALLVNCLDSFNSQWLGVDKMFRHMKEELERLSFDCYLVEKDDFTLEILKTIDRYGVVVLTGHGLFDSERDYGFMTCIKANESNLRLYSKDITAKPPRLAIRHNGKIRFAFEFLYEIYFDRVFIVLPEFFDHYLNTLPQSLIVMHSCYSCDSQKLSDIFIRRKGAGAFCGWKGPARRGSSKIVCELFSLLAKGKSLRDAFESLNTRNFCFNQLPTCEFYLWLKRVCFINDRVVGECSILDEGGKGYSQIAAALSESGFWVEERGENAVLPSTLREYDIVVFSTSWTKRVLDQTEVATMVNYVNAGGGLLLLGEHGLYVYRDVWNGSINLLGDQLGVRLAEGIICDPNDHLENPGDPDFGVDVPKIRKISRHPVTEGVSGLVLDLATVLYLTSPMQPVAWTDTDAWLDKNATRVDNFVFCRQDAFESTGSFPVIGVGELGRGRIAVIGDTSLWNNTLINYYDNKRLAYNVFLWLSRTK